MKTETTKQQKIFLVATLMATLLLSFQNCSSSVYLLTTGKPVQAKTDFSQILEDSESEINETKQQLKQKSQFEATSVAVEQDSRSSDDPQVEMTTGTDVRMKFVRKLTKKTPGRDPASAKSK